MKRYLLLLILCASIFAQTKSRIPSCTMKDCKCMECLDGTWKKHYKTEGECFAKTYISRCDIAEHMTASEEYDIESGQPAMGPMCSPACAKHDCKCGSDSTPTPVCHFGHDSSEHKGEN